ncbi:MAG: glycosyltransferase family 2 protein [Rubrobacteraceae bacterium]|nr:glycosyltransferase family 2 protein [Rubrobacteraceae bacterium]
MPAQPADNRLYVSLGRIESSTVDEKLLNIPSRKKAEGLTIFVPNYNHRAFLPRSLGSALDGLWVLGQEGFDAEILVVDDASRDGSQKFLRSIQALYNDARIKVMCLEENYGQARLWNIALKMSRYRHVLRMDADNELIPENLPLFMRAAEETSAAMVYGTLLQVKDGDAVDVLSNMPPTWRLLGGNYIDAFSIVDALRVLELGGIKRIHPYAPEDWELVLHLVTEEEEVVFVPAVLGYYHRHQLSASQDLQIHRSGVEALRRSYGQSGMRTWDSEKLGRIYHPDIGYLDEW